jgi:hypothetical protein
MLLSTDIWVSALLRRVAGAGAFAYVMRKGDACAGSVLLRIFNLRTSEVYLLRQVQKLDDMVWIKPVATHDALELQAFIDRQIGYDPDLWLIDIEDNEGRAFLTEKIDVS